MLWDVEMYQNSIWITMKFHIHHHIINHFPDIILWKIFTENCYKLEEKRIKWVLSFSLIHQIVLAKKKNSWYQIVLPLLQINKQTSFGKINLNLKFSKSMKSFFQMMVAITGHWIVLSIVTSNFKVSKYIVK